jgi:AraC-like DNA-binding protein/AmiR/NasT family two-component response regulator
MKNIKPTVLIVEDNFVIALDIRIILEGEGYLVLRTVSSFEAAILSIKTNKPDLVLIDISLHGEKDGINLANYLLRQRGTCYIYISSHSDKLTIDRVKESCPSGFIVKPFKRADIVTTIEIAFDNFSRNEKVAISAEQNVNIEVPFILKDIVKYIDEHIDKKISIDELSVISPWRSQHFIRVFTSFIGVTPYQYILKKKMEKAKDLICNTDLSYFEVCFELGFQSYANFSNAFKKTTGKTPAQYKKFFG